MFKRISYMIALQFTVVVFLLLFITGLIFLGASFADKLHRRQMHLEQMERGVIEHARDLNDILASVSPVLRSRIRATDLQGKTIYSGDLYSDIPFNAKLGTSTADVEHESYDILTTSVFADGRQVGYLQIADRSPPNDLTAQMLLFLLVSAGISFLTFGVGLFFARRSLRPAEQMMQRLEQFTQDASHELRTPLTAVGTSLDLALMTPDTREHVLSAKKDLKDISVLVERLLELARLDSFLLQKETVDLSRLVEESVEKYQVFAKEKQVTIRTEIAPKIDVKGDQALLRQVLSNLLMNAIKFNKPHGFIDVTLTGHILKIQDTGNGISESALPHVFNRFYQEDASRTKKKQGLGLGLALVKRIIDLHGWTIAVHSKPGEGTIFSIHTTTK